MSFNGNSIFILSFFVYILLYLSDQYKKNFTGEAGVNHHLAMIADSQY